VEKLLARRWVNRCRTFDALKARIPALADRFIKAATVAPECFEQREFHC